MHVHQRVSRSRSHFVSFDGIRRSGLIPFRFSSALVGTLLWLGFASRNFAVTYYVNGSAPTCSNSGAGSAAIPYCTISAAVAARSGAGVTISVSPAIYREQITVNGSGATGSPFVIFAAGSPGSPIVVDGADSISSASAWTPLSGDVWRAAAINWSPLQVFVDGARLTPSTASPAALPANSFVYVSGQGLYINIGGTNPGTHQTLVGRRSYGFRLNNASLVNIEGFTVLHTEDRGITVSGGSSCEITGNTVSLANKFGIGVTGASNTLIKSNIVSFCNDHGIYLTTGVTGANVIENESFGNARPNVRAANGIQFNGSSNNIAQRNRLHDNQDSGLQINSSSNNNLSLQNISWNNGDHGFDHLTSTGTVHLGDVAYHNYKDGFSIEGNSPGSTVVNCIAIDNGLTTNEFDLWVDSASAVGIVSDSNIFWNSTSQAPVKFISTIYKTLAAFSAAKGKDTHSTQANPRFVNAAAGDFHLLAGSPAIDSADSSIPNWPVTDAEGRTRADDPSVSNTGLGAIMYADRGALEFPVTTDENHPPDGSIDAPASDTTIGAGRSVTFSATGTDPDGNVPLSYSWDFGGGAPGATVEDPGAVGFNTPGTYTVTLTVRDALGLFDPMPDSRVITVLAPLTQPPNGTIDAPVGNTTISVGQSVNFAATASASEGQAPLSFAWSFGGGAPDQTIEDPGAVAFNTPGTYTVSFLVADAMGLADPTPDTRIITVQSASTNLVGNPSFETSTSGWTAYGGATIQRVAGGLDGAFVLEARATTQADFGINDTPNWVNTTGPVGTRYRVSAYVRAGSAHGLARLRVREYAGSTQVGANSYASATLSPNWQLLTLDFVTQRAGSTLDVQVFEQSGPAGDLFQVDAVSIVVVQ